MKKTIWLQSGLAAVGAGVFASPLPNMQLGFVVTAVDVAAPPPPNILLIVTDDAGYADFGMHGSTQMKTPHIDALAQSGIRFTQGYAASSVCAPSRMGLITGRFPARFGCENNLRPTSALGLSLGETTMADMLRQAGYRTYAIGKWHMGVATGYHPLDRGFDHFWGFLGGERNYLKLSPAVQESQPYKRILEDRNPIPEEDWYTTDKWTDKAAEYIHKHLDEHKSEPFFMYLCYNAVHVPMEADEQSLKNTEGLDFAGDEGRRILGAMTESLDRNIGRLMDTLEQEGISDNTLVVFVNDNGGPPMKNHSSNAPFKGAKSTFYEGGIRIPFLIRWPDRIKPGQVVDTPVISLDLYPTFAQIAGADLSKQSPVDGVSLVRALETADWALPRDELFWRIRGFGALNEAALRKGDWKIYHDPRADKTWLYNLQENPRESKDFSASYPEKFSEMKQRLAEYESQMSEPSYWWTDAMYEEGKTENTPIPR